MVNEASVDKNLINELREFFSTSDLRPGQETYVDTEEKKVCGLTACVLSRGQNTLEEIDEAEEQEALIFARLSDYPTNFKLGFVTGWDGNGEYASKEQLEDREFVRGMRTGKIAYGEVTFALFQKGKL